MSFWSRHQIFEKNSIVLVAGILVVIAIGGGRGTLSEIALALKTGVPVLGLDTWEIDGVEAVKDAGAAVKRALELAD